MTITGPEQRKWISVINITWNWDPTYGFFSHSLRMNAVLWSKLIFTKNVTPRSIEDFKLANKIIHYIYMFIDASFETSTGFIMQEKIVIGKMFFLIQSHLQYHTEFNIISLFNNTRLKSIDLPFTISWAVFLNSLLFGRIISRNRFCLKLVKEGFHPHLRCGSERFKHGSHGACSSQ